VPSLLPWYIRRFTYNSIIDPLLALQLNHRMTLLYLRKHLGIDTFSSFKIFVKTNCLKRNVLNLHGRTSGGGEGGIFRINGTTRRCDLRGNSLVENGPRGCDVMTFDSHVD
jgi:hypothetical protein